MFQRIRSLVLKELLAILRDPKGRFILIVPPIIQMVVFTFAATQEVKDVPIAVLNHDRGVHGRDLVARLEGSPNFSRVLYLGSDAEVAAAIDSRRALMVVYLGPTFSRNLAAGEPAEVRLEPPHGHQDLRGHSVLATDLLQQRTMLRVHPLRGPDGVAGQPPFQVCIEIERELRLRAVALEDAIDRLDTRKGGLDDLRLDTSGKRFAAQIGEPGVEGRERGDRRHGRRFLSPRNGDARDQAEEQPADRARHERL